MSTQYSDLDTSARPRRSLVSLLILAVLAFVAGLAFMAWLLDRWPAAAETLGVAAPLPAAVAEPAPQPTAPLIVQNPTIVPAPDPELNRRVSTLEQRVGAVDVRAREAVGNADRAENLLIAFAARRAIERGVGLGYLEALVRQRFGNSQPQAVATVIAASNQPVTLQQLQQSLHELGPELMVADPKRNWWRALKQEFGDLVSIRQSDIPSSMPSERLARAQQRLESGQVNVALAEVNRLPGRERAGGWFAAARRYIAAHDALDRIESAALLDPRADTSTPAAATRPAVTPTS